MKIFATFFLLFVSQCPALAQGASSADTVFIKRDAKGKFHENVYIEPDKASLYYDLIINFGMDEFESSAYARSIDFARPSAIWGRKEVSKSLPRRWVGLYRYQRNYYLYAPCDWGSKFGLKVTDSTFMFFQGHEGVGGMVIDRYQKIDNNTFAFALWRYWAGGLSWTKFIIHMVDWEAGIAVLEDCSGFTGRYRLIVDADKARQYPIINNFCRYNRTAEFEFDEIDLKNY